MQPASTIFSYGDSQVALILKKEPLRGVQGKSRTAGLSLAPIPTAGPRDSAWGEKNLAIVLLEKASTCGSPRGRGEVAGDLGKAWHGSQETGRMGGKASLRLCVILELMET